MEAGRGWIPGMAQNPITTFRNFAVLVSDQ
jgi:hypothetical protein